MNKQELVKVLADKLNLSQVKTADTLDVVLDTIMEETRKGGKVVVSPHKFILKNREARMGFNPRTHERIEIGPSSKIIYKEIGN